MDLGVFQLRGEAQRFGERWLLICDLVGGLVGTAIAIAVLLVAVS